MTEIPNDQPRGLRFFSGVCIFLGVLSLFVNIILFAGGYIYKLSPKVGDIGPAYRVHLLFLIHIIRDFGYVFCGLMIRKRRNWPRQLLLVLVGTSLFELIFNTVSDIRMGRLPIDSRTAFFVLTVFFVDASIFYYFTRSSVKGFLSPSK